jgi:hypothetical protein
MCHPECEMRSISEYVTQGITRGRLMQAAAPEAQLLPFALMFLLTRMSSTCLDYVVSCDKESPCFKIATATDISMLQDKLKMFL